MFKKEISPYSVSDKVTFRNVDKTLTLYVRADAFSLTFGLKQVHERLASVTDNSTEEDQAAAARLFADTIFGTEQGEKLCAFYDAPLATINACGIYFRERLTKKITKAQIRRDMKITVWKRK